jgi:hypothetical protein
MSKWLRPLKVREYYLDSHFDSIRAADKWLYLAVVRGVVRARSKGFILGSKWIKQLSKMTSIHRRDVLIIVLLNPWHSSHTVSMMTSWPHLQIAPQLTKRRPSV